VNSSASAARASGAQRFAQCVVIRPWLAQAVACLAPLAAEHGVALLCETDPALPTHLQCHADGLRSLVDELVRLAIEAAAARTVPNSMPQRAGQVCVRAALGEGGYWRVQVADNGPGIAANIQAELLSPVLPPEPDDAAQARLLACQRLARSMGGRIEIDSEPGKGAQVTARLPLVARLPQARPARRLLVAEDDEAARLVLEAQLNRLGYDCDLARDGQQALHAWMSSPHDYAGVITDCDMPVLGGHDLAAAIRLRERAGTRLPIIMLTTNAEHLHKPVCPVRGVDQVLRKPLNIESLNATLQRWAVESSVGVAANA
jgi:CheY-like chemotaxis protein